MRFRLTRPEDLVVARDFIPEAYRYPPDIHAALPNIWMELLRKGELVTGVVEDPGRPADDRIVGVGLAVFVTEDFADSALDEPEPYLNARLHRMILEGCSPVLDRRQIAQANAGAGLSLQALHFCMRGFDINDPNFVPMTTAAQDLFLLCGAGYRLKRIFKEVTIAPLAAYMRASGMALRSAFSDRPEIVAVAEDQRPQLLCIDHENVPHGSVLSRMFFAQPPRFGFSPAEQRLLQCALLHETDEEVAADLGISIDTLRKQWRSIYQRVQFSDPVFFGSDGGDGDARNGRGREKRRHLLAYIRLHAEELRPYRPTASARDRHQPASERTGLQAM